jgi:hypothetical protein
MIAIEQKNTTNSSTVVLGMAYPRSYAHTLELLYCGDPFCVA